MKVYLLTVLMAFGSLFGITTVTNAQRAKTTTLNTSSNLMDTKSQLRQLIDAYAYLGDEKKISEQMNLFTPDATYKVYMNGALVANITGTANIEKEFTGHASQVKTYFTMNGQHIVNIATNTATGISFSQIKMIRESEGKKILTDYSVKYDDKYIRQNGKWLIKERIGYFIIVEERPYK